MTRSQSVIYSCDDIIFARVLGTPLNPHVVEEHDQYKKTCKKIDSLDIILSSLNEQRMMASEDFNSYCTNYPELVQYNNDLNQLHREIYSAEWFLHSLETNSDGTPSDVSSELKLITQERIMMMIEDIKSSALYKKSHVNAFDTVLDNLTKLTYLFLHHRKQYTDAYDANYTLLLKICAKLTI